MKDVQWTPEFAKYYFASQRFASRRWWQFWVKKPKPFNGSILQVSKNSSWAKAWWLHHC
jgi:hypothetical protein